MLRMETATSIAAIPIRSIGLKLSFNKIIENNNAEIASRPAIREPFMGPIILTPARKQVNANIVPIIIIARSASIVITSKSTFIFHGFTMMVRKIPPISIPNPVTTMLEYFFKIFIGRIEYMTTAKAAENPQNNPEVVITSLCMFKCVARVNIPKTAREMDVISLFWGNLFSMKHIPITINIELKNCITVAVGAFV